MISLQHSVSGSEIGKELVHDPEEMAYALMAMIENGHENLGQDLSYHLPDGEKEAVCDFLRILADKIEAAE